MIARMRGSIDERRERVAELYPLDRTLQSIADELGVSLGTIHHDVAELERRNRIKKRARGAMISVAMADWWASDAGQQERARRRSGDAKDEKVCASCGHLAAGEYCAPCRQEMTADARLEQLQNGHAEWLARRGAGVATLKAESGLLDVDDVITALPREFPRSQPAISGHIAAGALVPTPNEFGVLLFTRAAVDEYVAWLRAHPDWRLNRFNAISEAPARWRATWYRLRHKSESEFGRLAAVISKPGPKKKYSDDEANQVRELRTQGLSYGQIEVRSGLSKKQIRGILAPEGD